MDADAPPPRTWTSGSFRDRYWGFLCSGLVAGQVSAWLIGPIGITSYLVNTIRYPDIYGTFHWEKLLSFTLTSFAFNLIGLVGWGPFILVAAIVPATKWPRLAVPLSRSEFKRLLLGSVAVGLSVEFIFAAIQVIQQAFDPANNDLWSLAGTGLGLCHGTGALAGLLVFLWTPEAKEYRRRRKAERKTGSPPAAPA